MAEQADNLRKWARQQAGDGEGRTPGQTRLIAVGSGKGGVGKSNISLNLALALQQSGRRIALIDADLGFSNLEILLGIRAQYTLQDVFAGRVELSAAFTLAPTGLMLISGGSGTLPGAAQSGLYVTRFAQQLAAIDGQYDLIFVDFGAGFGPYSAEMMGLCDELLMITTPEPTALTDAYALVKMMSQGHALPPIRLLVNRVREQASAVEAGEKFATVCQRFLSIRVEQLGAIPEDVAVLRAVSRQSPFFLAEPNSPAARAIRSLTRAPWLAQLTEAAQSLPANDSRGIRALFDRFVKRRSEGRT